MPFIHRKKSGESVCREEEEDGDIERRLRDAEFSLHHAERYPGDQPEHEPEIKIYLPIKSDALQCHSRKKYRESERKHEHRDRDQLIEKSDGDILLGRSHPTILHRLEIQHTFCS